MATIDLPPDPYQALGVSKDANVQEIRLAYRKLAVRCHPDKFHDPQIKAQKQDEFHRVQMAYELLSDDREREKYDNLVRLAEVRGQRAGHAGATGQTGSRTRKVWDDVGKGSRSESRRSEMDRLAEHYARQRVSRSRAKATDEPSLVSQASAGAAERSPPRPAASPAEGGQPGARGHSRARSDEGGYNQQSSSELFNKRKSDRRRSGGASPPSSFRQPRVVSSSPVKGESTGSRWNRFRRSSAPSKPRGTASRAGSHGSPTSMRSVGSQISQEDMDKFDYVLQAMEDLLDKHIKRLRGRFLRNLARSAKSHKNQCREALTSLQATVLEQYEHNGTGRADAADAEGDDNARYRLLLDLFDELRLELADFSQHDLSKPGADSYCALFCGRIKFFASRLSLYGVKASKREETTRHGDAEAESMGVNGPSAC
ncbi:hypothetical protein JDV02_008910 [Purpureocillium takamizusanense]|uniref:J domain-containing protein n=1 Tax=Purpureocillium takamizusanense TaxID=2060973 RepID=A0A9Q8QNW1_9HYPO|nr:uncharacterized protein JDV02_008910 [Purpureocillium takamizusanense]UNI23070.1 hypothetical protein JDV02_008910 [Purpureocillium takamizusanense]